jgi:nucleoside-diphosphate-sugar epimerase
MNILVTGATGFVGTRLCRMLEDQGHEVVRVGRSARSPAVVDVGDIGPDTDWQKVPGKPDAIVHLAARVHVMRDAAVDPGAAFRRVNVEGTLTLARHALAAGVGRFVYVSSIKVNGESTSPIMPFRAEDPPAPQDAYAVSKHEAETGLEVLARNTGMEVVIVRPPLVYGPGSNGNFASLVNWVRKGIPLPLRAVHNRRSLVALDNLADFLALCANRQLSPRAAGQVFLIADGSDLSTPELLYKVAGAYGAPARLVPVPERWLRLAARLLGKSAEADRLLGSLVVDIAKARDLLGWRPVVTVDQQLQKMASDAEAD